jgi:hypothetical protein
MIESLIPLFSNTMFSNRGSQYVERIIPALLSDHVQQRSPDGIQLIDLSTAENKLMHDWTSRIIRSSVSDVKTEVCLSLIIGTINRESPTAKNRNSLSGQTLGVVRPVEQRWHPFSIPISGHYVRFNRLR